MKGVFFFLGLVMTLGCGQQEKDKDIKKTITVKAKDEPAFVAVNYMVRNGVVTLSGNVPSEVEKTKVEEKVKDMAGVKEVVNNLVVEPVVLDTDHLLKKSVDSVLQKYPTVQALVQDSMIVIEGSIGSKKAQKLFNALQRLQSKGVTNQLVISEE